MQRIRVASVADFKEKNPIKFACGPPKEGFVVAWKKRFFAYENICRHLALPLDVGDGGFFSPDGKHLGTVIAPRHPHNMAWGDDDGKTLYLCARSGLYKMRLNIPGIRP